ncbi:serine hydrolase domain-containing protein [Reichenbachiella sp.]|uniref:serine hydrolase domain-containing protein n=1 Tax=Reichenbachiella sp. TaxID=2184521 RepID=UPI003BAFAA9C
MKKTLTQLIILSLFAGGGLHAQNQLFLEQLKLEVQKQKIPGAQVAVIKNKQVILRENFGYAEVAFGVPVGKSTIFSINSIAKVFAGTAIMQLVEQNKIDLNKPIGNYLDSLPKTWQKVTVRQLLSHTSGLPDIEDLENGGLIGGKGEAFAWEAVQNKPLQFLAGEKFSYNATNYLLVQRIIERYGELSYVDFLQKNQFDVAGVDHIVFGSSYDVVKNKTATYSYYLKDKLTGEYVKGDMLYEIMEEFSPILRADAGAFATIDDLTKWLIALQSGKFISKESMQQMWQPVPLNNGEFRGFGGFLNGYGYGWPVMRRASHSGVAPIGGGRAALIVYPEDDLTIILLTNLTGSSPQKIIEKVSKYYFED